MTLYAGIDLHSNNSVIVVLDEHDREVYRKRHRNELHELLSAQRGCGPIESVAVESTYNWCCLVDGLQDAGFEVRLVNTAAVKQYDGLKHTGDFSDARHLAHLLRSGILPTGYIYPRQGRALPHRFASPGNFAAYARTVDSRRESNGKKKGEGNAKCGNK